MKTKLKFESVDDCSNHPRYIIKAPKGGELTITGIHNALVNQYGGGCWVLLLNCNDCECVGKLSEIEYAEADDKYFA